MEWTAERRRRIERLIARSGNDDFRDVVRQTGGLPVYRDMGGCLAILPDGQIVSLNTETDDVEVETRPAWRTIALVHAARTYPELVDLFPSRPPSAPDCEECAGSGKLTHPAAVEAGVELECGTCGGVGWLPK